MPVDASRWARVATWFDELVELAPAMRAARLAAIAAEDPVAEAELRALLEADACGDGVLDAGVEGSLHGLAGGARAAAPADGRIGPYRVLEPIGEGGMGVVFLAERSDGAYEQRVAIKLIRRGMDSATILQRFLRERRILARLAHPHVVRLLDGGVCADGRPYYAMEHVEGESLTAYASARRLSLRGRVELVARVVDAVAYAHAQLVVHRDLKPSNVLVDAGGAPHVLDFGIAKLLEESGERTVTAARALSPAYAAPEQVLGEAVGTAADVYALGLVLFELLVGRLPRRDANAARETVGDVLERPSTLAARVDAAGIEGQYGAGMSPAALARQLAGDGDAIIGKCLQREPARRYASAAALADDLRRWLDGRPIAARADSGLYRARKFVRRHRVGVAAACLVAAALVAGLGMAVWQWRHARDEALRADAERANAERQLARAERVKQYMLALFREQDPISRAKANARPAAQLVADGVVQVDAALAGEPELQAELLRDLGEMQLNLDQNAAAAATLARAWELHKRIAGADSLVATETLVAYAGGVYASGDVQAAAPLFDAAIRRLRELGAARGARMAQAEAGAARVALIRGDNDEAIRLARDAADIMLERNGPRSMERVSPLETLGKVLHEAARFPEALETLREALGIVEAAGGGDTARAAVLHTSIGDTLRVQRRYDAALPEYETALRIARAQLPGDHAIVGGILIRLADLQRRTGRLDAADASLTEAIGILARTPGGQYAQALQFHGNLARAQGRPDLAARRYHASYEAFRAATGDSVYTWLTALEEVGALVQLGRLDEADALATQAAATMARLAKDDSYEAAYVLSVVGTLRQAQGRVAEAVETRRRALALIGKAYGPDHAEVAQARAELAASLVASGGAAARREAATLLESARASLERGGDGTAEPILGVVYLVRSRVRRREGDAAGARTDVAQAIARLQAPEHALRLREARALARELGG